MNRLRSLFSPEERALLDQEREILPLPATVQARVMARARASVAAGIGLGGVPAPPQRPRRLAAAAAICIVSAAVGAAAYEIRLHITPPPDSRPAAVSPLETVAPPAVAPPVVAPPPSPSGPSAPIVEEPSAPASARGKSALSRVAAGRAELRLLRQARAAVAREDYTGALRPIAEHARWFRDGRLTEEREALRVKALAGCGRTEDARRAAAAFAARFPRSVLLPAVSQMPSSEP